MIEFIDWRVFIISLAFGLLYIYIIEPPFKQIYVFPTPDNIGKIQYVDDSDNCFNFKSSEVACPQNEDHIENYLVQ